ncbi:hypothetical protein SC698_13135 [Legionella pneumophila serogroup 1]|nr:Uncharacterised protein [Legionella pneumophila]
MIDFVGLFTANFEAHLPQRLKLAEAYRQNIGTKVMLLKLPKRYLIMIKTVGLDEIVSFTFNIKQALYSSDAKDWVRG